MVVRTAALLLLVTSAFGCVFNKRDLVEPPKGEAAVLLVSTEMPQPISDIARHGWFAVRDKGSDDWQRIEVGTFGSGPFDGEGDVMLHEVWTGERATVAIACLRKHAPDYRPGGKYMAWPGPNSNTFVDKLLRTCRLRADLPATSIGRDYRGIIGMSWTSGGTGFQVETPIVGFRLGLTEGVEVHLFGFALGIDLWPPALIVPFGSGRLGFDDR
jgi:hypothetical protein